MHKAALDMSEIFERQHLGTLSFMYLRQSVDMYVNWKIVNAWGEPVALSIRVGTSSNSQWPHMVHSFPT